MKDLCSYIMTLTDKSTKEYLQSCLRELTDIAENVLKKQPHENIKGEQPVIDKSKHL